MDISIDLRPASPTYRDLLVVNGDLALTSDVNPAGTSAILQDILQRMRMFKGEWFLDKTLGVPWFQQILVKAPNRALVDNLLQGCILATPGVLRLTRWSVVFTPASRVASVTFTAVTTTGTVSYDGPLNNAGAMVTQ